MEEKIKNSILNTTKYVLKNFNTFKDIRLNIKKSLSSSLGNEWFVIVSIDGIESDQQLYKNISSPRNFISFRIESIESIIFRLNQNNEEKVNNFRNIEK